MSIRLSLDRFEGKSKQIAVLVTDDGEIVNLPKSLLPPGTKPGDVLTLTLERDAAASHQVAAGNPPRPGQAGRTRPRWRYQAVNSHRFRRVFAFVFSAIAFTTASPSTERSFSGRRRPSRPPSRSSTSARGTRS